MHKKLQISTVAPDNSSFDIIEGTVVTISKIVSNNNVDFLLYPSLTLIIKTLDGKETLLRRSLVSYITPQYANIKVLELTEELYVKSGLSIGIIDNGRNIDYNLSIGYTVNK